MILGRKFTFHHNALILYLLYHEMLGDFVKKIYKLTKCAGITYAVSLIIWIDFGI